MLLDPRKAASMRKEAIPKDIREIGREVQAKTREAEQDALRKGTDVFRRSLI